MPNKVKIGLLIPTSFGETLPKPQAFADFFREADELGFDSLWVIDRISHQTAKVLDPLTVLSYAAAATSRIRLGTAVLLFPFRSPVLIAKSAATLDYLSGGRLTLGVSLGGGYREYQALGVPIRERVGRLREGLEIMRKLWTESEVTFHGRFYDLERVKIEPKPTQRPSIPILMGGQVDAVLRRSVELADGWIAGSFATPDKLRESVEKISHYVREQGRDVGALEIGKLLYIAVEDDRQRARERVKAYTYTYYGPEYPVDQVTVFGPPQECAGKLQELADAGAKTLMLGMTWPDRAELARIAREIVPRLS